jgi:hypothetical protein
MLRRNFSRFAPYLPIAVLVFLLPIVLQPMLPAGFGLSLGNSFASILSPSAPNDHGPFKVQEGKSVEVRNAQTNELVSTVTNRGDVIEVHDEGAEPVFYLDSDCYSPTQTRWCWLNTTLGPNEISYFPDERLVVVKPKDGFYVIWRDAP